MSGIVAIVGRPNVGKSALFNRLVGRRIAIVHDLPGVTRDRISAEAEWRGRPFSVLDTGGIGLLRGEREEDVILRAALDQVQLAIESADVLVLVVNVQEGVVPLDREVAQRLRCAGKPVLVAVNKADNARAEEGLTEFAELGFEKLLPVSAIHGRGMSDLLDAVLAHLPPIPPGGAGVPPASKGSMPPGHDREDDRPSADPAQTTPNEGPPDETPDAASALDAPGPRGPLKLAVVGRPNVGKSSLINALIHAERVIVSPVPGTTRDSVDVPFTVATDGRIEPYVLIDTAGMRKARRVNDSIEFFSVKRAEDSIARCDIVLFILDAESGILEQDKKIADKIVAARKGCLVILNKWDLFADAVRTARPAEVKRPRGRGRHGAAAPMTTLAEFGRWVQEKLFFLDYAPVIFTSATAGTNLDRLLEAVRYVAAQLQQTIPTAVLSGRCATRRRRTSRSARAASGSSFSATQTRRAAHVPCCS
ncbi:MAG: ribosome biogenesis GTPase Der [Verrucomicrobiales bacterium]|nr:ribosome biogenesis GTPase Der [Verrucomicrobiales bacterium]